VARASNAPFDALSDLLLAKIEYLVANSGTCAAGQLRREQTRRPIPFLSALVSHWSRTGLALVVVGLVLDVEVMVTSRSRTYPGSSPYSRNPFGQGTKEGNVSPPTPPMDD